MEPLPLSLTLEHDTLAELERGFAPRVGDGVVFLPGIDAPLVGSVVKADVALRGGEVALSVTGAVAWRYPANATPLGREPGVGVLVDECTSEHRALLARMQALDDAGTLARAPGSRLSLHLREAREVRPATPPPTESPASTPFDSGFEIRTADFVLAEHEGRLLVKRAGDDAEQGTRPLPPPPGYPQGPLPRPTLEGAAFSYAYDTEKPPLELKTFETFAWPEVGTLRPQRADMRTWPPGFEASSHEDYRSPWDDVTDDQRARHSQVELSDPAARVTDVVTNAVADMAGVDDALGPAPRRTPPPLVGDDDGVENTETDARGLVTESSEEPVGSLPVGLRVRVDDGAAEELFATGLGVPTATTRTLPRVDGHPTVKIAVLEGDLEGAGRHLGTVRVKLPKGRDTVDVRFQIDADGFLELRSHDDPTVRERLRTSWAAPVELPKPRPRGLLARLFGR